MHNYGGRRKRAYANESIRRLLLDFPAHISVLQEHEPAVLHASDHDDVIVCLGLDENRQETGLAIMGKKQHTEKRTPCISAIDLLACRTIICKGNITAMMVAQVHRPEGIPIVIVNMHFHHNTAKKAPGHSQSYRDVLDLLVDLIRTHNAVLLIGDFNQAAPHMVAELKDRLPMPIHADSHHPTFKDCICIFGLGAQAPGQDSDISIWKHLNGAHWPLARHYGSKPKRTEQGEASRKRKSLERWAAAKARAKAKASSSAGD